MLSALELSASEGAIVLEGEGVFVEDASRQLVALQFDATYKDGTYVKRDGDRKSFTRKDIGF